MSTIKCSFDDDIFSPQEKTTPVTLEIPFDEASADYEYDNNVLLQLEGRFDAVIIERTDTENMQVSFNARFFRYKSDIMIFDDGRKHLCSLSFQTDEIAEKVMKIVWKYKHKEVRVKDVVDDPPYTITHSYHDLAAVFSYEEKTDPIKVSLSDGTLSDDSCKLYIDIAKEVIRITNAVWDNLTVTFSQMLARKESYLFFKLDDRKLKLLFDDAKTAEKVYKMLRQVQDTNKVRKAEETTLTLALEKLEEDPGSMEEVKELIKYYSKIFTIFKEEHQNRIFELYQKYDFHEKIVAASDSYNAEHGDTEVGSLKCGTGIGTLNSRKRKAASHIEVPAKKIKKDESEVIFYPDFEFQCDKEGVPKKELIVFASKTKVYKFSLDSSGYECSGCTGEAVKAKYYVNEYGETFIKTKGNHNCRPVLHKDEKISPTKMPLFEFCLERQNRSSSSSKILRVFTPSRTAAYEYLHLEDSETELWYCIKCKVQGKYVYSHVEKSAEGEQMVVLLDEDHVCCPVGYKLPEKVVELVEDDFDF